VAGRCAALSKIEMSEFRFGRPDVGVNFVLIFVLEFYERRDEGGIACSYRNIYLSFDNGKKCQDFGCMICLGFHLHI
jgi:hypothetical protein